MVKIAFIILLVLSLISVTTQQIGFGCPPEWESNANQCYRFYFDKPRVYQEAASACWVQGSALVSVNSMSEHLFISKYLNQHGRTSAGIWYTSGEALPGIDAVKWNGDGTYTNHSTSVYWNSPADYAILYMHVVYKYSDVNQRFGWSKVSSNTPLYYICEIPRTEVSRIIQQTRDFGFGSNESTPALYKRGPEFVVQPENTVVVDSGRSMILDCVAVGIPQPVYKWYEMNATFSNPTLHHMSTYKEITSIMDTRYTFTNGRLTIQTPRETTDAGQYQCEATNQFGSLLSEPMSLTFGYLNEFSPNQRGFVVGLLNKGTYINCNPPSYKPMLKYQWFRDPDVNNTGGNVYTKTLIASNFIRPDLNTYTFISQNGNLYFSEVQYTDKGQYYCVVTLAAPVGSKLSTRQPPSRTSRGIELQVHGNPSSEYGPIIHTDFIAVFPKPPMVGHDVTLECFAYGKMPLVYSWSRADKPFPKGTTFWFDNRVMTIPNAKLEDTGNYTCKVVKITGKETMDSKSIVLTLEAKPVFTFPLRNMHADVGSSLTWRCEAEAVPKAVYAWYKNSQLLKNIPGQLEIHENVLHILRLDQTRDEGMYQCSASNAHGTSITSAQLRVLSIAPSFYKSSLSRETVTSQGGNLTIACRPEAAPTPDITWTRNGQILGGDGRTTVSMDGTLHITQLTISDQGMYMCKATNINGESQTSTRVYVYAGVRYSTRPLDTTVEINRTQFLPCQANYDYTRYDLAYIWKFNGRVIDGQHDQFYRTDQRQGVDGLYIVNAQYFHTGTYECIAQTVFASLSVKAYLAVTGPPDEPAGVYVESNSIVGTSLRLMWTWSPFANHGYPVNYFVVEAHTEFNSSWIVLAEDIPAPFTVIPGEENKRFFIVKDLLPNNGYSFRVTAKNDKGVGTPSKPKGVYRIPSAAPIRYPSNVGGGGGSVGILTMTWQPLRRSEEGGKGFGYKVFWRLANQSNTQWREKDVGNTTMYAHTVGADNFYLLYEVMVQAYNVKEGTDEKRYGPTSPVAYVYSAEGMPVQRPSNVKYQNINGTAILVTWDPVPNTREAIKGRVLGYEIIWIERGGDNKTRFTFVYCDTCTSGYVIGLPPGGYFWIRVVVFNTAGRGVPSEKYLATTYENPPGRFPLFVDVHSYLPHSAKVTWRGVNIILGESTLYGYKLMWWPVGDDIRTANTTKVGRVTEAFIHGLQFDTIYKLRMMAYNRGGDGKKSPTVYFTVEKGGSINVNQASFDPSTSQLVLASASKLVQHNVLLFLIFVLYIIFR